MKSEIIEAHVRTRRPRTTKRRSLPVSEIKIARRLRRDLGDIDSLAENIENQGLLQPIVITPDSTLIAGQRRLEVYKHLGRTEIPVHVVDVENVSLAEFDENVFRKTLTPSEWVEAYRLCEANERNKAKKRQGSSGNFPEEERGEVRNRIGKGLGISGRTLDKAKQIVEAAEADPRHEDLVCEMDRTGKVDGVYKKLKARKQTEKPEESRIGAFEVVVIDPPAGTSMASIARLPLIEIAAPDSVIFLWATNAGLADAFELLRRWKVKYKAMLSLKSQDPDEAGFLRDETEHCLVAVRGNPVLQDSTRGTILRRKSRDSSRRPESFYTLLEELTSGTKVDVYAGRTRDGWSSPPELVSSDRSSQRKRAAR